MNMQTTTLDPSFLRAVVLMTGFKPSPMRNAQAALLAIGLRMAEFTAADLQKYTEIGPLVPADQVLAQLEKSQHKVKAKKKTKA